jgi:hypothetical protein
MLNKKEISQRLYARGKQGKIMNFYTYGDLRERINKVAARYGKYRRSRLLCMLIENGLKEFEKDNK